MCLKYGAGLLISIWLGQDENLYILFCIYKFKNKYCVNQKYVLIESNNLNLRLEMFYYTHKVKPVLRGHLWDKEKVALYNRLPLKRGSICMKISMTTRKR